MEEVNNTRLAKEALTQAGIHVQAAELVIRAQEIGLRNIEARLVEVQKRADLYEQRMDANTEKAARTVQLEQACEKLLAALDRLPLEMKDAGMILKPTPSEILLYDTYDWQAVMEAKFELMAAIKEEE